MRVIHKVALRDVETTIKVSNGAYRPLTVHNQDGNIVVWYETVEHLVIPAEITFKIVGTGYIVPEKSEYVGTAFLDNMVWHVYQTPPTKVQN